MLINPRSGSSRGPSAEELRTEAERRGIAARVLRTEDDPVELAQDADAEVLGAAGGDGSVASVAAVAVERDLPFVCVPFGTRNHFARDLGLERDDPIAALAAFRGVERRIDVGYAGARMFLNNVSLGVYARLVHRREHHRRRREALARVRAWTMLLRQRDSLGITLDGVPVEAQLVLVANNAYVLELPSIGARKQLDEGRLHLYVVRGGVEERSAASLVLDARAGSVEAAVDGEPDVLRTPIEFRIAPAALRVLVPPGAQDV